MSDFSELLLSSARPGWLADVQLKEVGGVWALDRLLCM